MGTPMKGFFDRVDVVAETMAFATTTAAQGVPVETPIPSIETRLVEEGAQTEGVSEPAFIPVETPHPFLVMPLVGSMQICLLMRDQRRFLRILMMGLP